MLKFDLLQNRFAVVCLSFLVGLSITACGGSGGGGAGSAPVGSTSYSGPGSKWDFDLKDDNTFVVTRRNSVSDPITLTVEGTWARLASGFLKLTVTSSVGADGPSPGDMAWGLEVPGYALMLKPIEAGSEQLLAMVTSGSCPSTDIDANWVIVNNDGGSAADAGRDFFGAFHWDNTASSASLPSRYDLAGFTDQGSNAIGAGSCSNGLMLVPGATMYLTANAGAMVHLDSGTPADESDDHFVFALPQKATGGLPSFAGNYAGMLFDDSSSSGKIQPVSMVCDNAGGCTGNIVTNIDTGSVSSDSVTVTLSTADSPETGMITGSITSSEPGSSAGNLGCIADVNAIGSGKTIISCVGQSPGDTSKLFNVMFVTK